MIALALLVTTWLYLRGVRAAWSRAGTGRGVTKSQVALFATGLVVIAAALLSPLDGMADGSFAAHMTQHVLLAELAPPFLVFGAPLAAFAWAIPARRRRTVVAFLQRRSWLRTFWRALTAPALGWILHLMAIWLWHAPPLYQLALRHELVHAMEHLSFIATAVLVWWPIAHPRVARRSAYAAGLGTVFLTAMQTGVLGALITLSHHLLYPLQARGTTQWGLSPMDDQTLAGLIMWVPGGLIYVAAMSVLFLKWLQPANGGAARVKLAPSLAAVVVVLLALPATACSRPNENVVPGGSVERGKVAVEAMGCGACHAIPGIRNADGMVGPPLTNIASRSILAGELANTPENMIRWIQNPQAIEPNTAMPNLGMSSQSARDITAFLYTLH